MGESAKILAGRRGSVRRAVDLTCQVMSDLWDGSAPHVARDMSPGGVWLDTELPLELGERVVVAVTPPGMMFPLYLFGRVRRVRLARRRSDGFCSGMAVEFERVSAWDTRVIKQALMKLPAPAIGPRYGRAETTPQAKKGVNNRGWLEGGQGGEGPLAGAGDEHGELLELRLECAGELVTAGGAGSFWH